MSFLKFAYVRSPKLLAACRCIPCQHCEKDDGTVCASHSNQGKHGKGKAIKASDVFVAALCFHCHTKLDQGREGGRAERVALWSAAHSKTVDQLLKRGLWPDGVQVPNVHKSMRIGACA